MENIKEFPCGILDPVISLSPSDGWVERALDPGPKLQAASLKLDHSHWGLPRVVKAPSSKLQAPSNKL